MSRIGKNPIVLPAGVEISVGEQITVRGPLGTLKAITHPAVTISVDGQNVQVSKVDGAANAAAMWGTMRANLNNMVTGVSKGFERKLQLVGVGYRAQAQGDVLNLSLGFSHPVAHKMPAGVKVECPTQTEILIKGADKQQVGQVAAEVRAYRKPEPYKGKGVRYSDEVVVIKETKKK
ncbi:50S ribosomal protein L6 [Ferribacterium limneticum]|uniref:50S ribosomal protein L6 n=1 Tax=Ferribacterium limneticum TaxID=76259 RepID=UPI001CF804A2|nr:50S ribosomal protein L6 [Ferribacterium limneticum]UCV23323.1 50S ribosomal protein L6 [Ferribacterium limneticum]